MNLERIRRILSDAVPKSAPLALAYPPYTLQKKRPRIVIEM